MCGFKSVLLTKHDFEKLEARCPREFEAVVNRFSSYIEFGCSGSLPFGNPKMGSFGILQAKNVKKIL